METRRVVSLLEVAASVVDSAGVVAVALRLGCDGCGGAM